MIFVLFIVNLLVLTLRAQVLSIFIYYVIRPDLVLVHSQSTAQTPRRKRKFQRLSFWTDMKDLDDTVLTIETPRAHNVRAKRLIFVWTGADVTREKMVTECASKSAEGESDMGYGWWRGIVHWGSKPDGYSGYH